MKSPILALLLLSAVRPVFAEEAAPPPDATKGWHRLVGIVQYLESDYPAAVESASPSELEEQSAFTDEAVDTLGTLGPAAAPFEERLKSIQARVKQVKDAPGVSKDCGALVEELVQAGGLSRSPRQPPSIARGGELYAVNCAGCHAANGSGDVQIAATMEPRPANFLDPARMDGLSPYKAFNALSFGITGTAMPAFPTLTETERWDLAFFLFTLRQPACDHAPPGESLETLATATDPMLVQAHGQAELACLRRRLPDADEERALLVARSGIEEAIRLAAQGHPAAAKTAVVDAYLRGIEPVEPLLRARNPEQVMALEAAFSRVRLAAERADPSLDREAHALLTEIDRARRSRPGSQSAFSVFWLALLILVREGFEATIVIAALLAVLKKMKQPEHAKVVHAGWISAILVGGAAFVFFRHLIVGANRELIEGVFALGAVGMLIYAALWLNARANIRKFMGEIRARMQGALGRGSAVGLFTIAFTAMLRESLETAVFLQGLAIDSGTGVLWGICGGLVVLGVLVVFINRVGYRLPMKPLFNASTVLLLATAVMLVGKGVHALQEVGWIPLHPIRFIRVDALGIFPDLFSLLPQLVLALAPALWFGVLRREREPEAESPSKA